MYDLIVIGSGLSSTFFLKKLNVNQNEKVCIINYKINKNSFRVKNDSIFIKNLPPRFNKENTFVIHEYFNKNNIKVENNCSLIGILDQGGVSNYWGYSCEFPNLNRTSFLGEGNKLDLSNSFKEIYNEYKFEGEVDIEGLKFNEKKIEPFFSRMLNIKNEKIQFFKNCSAINSHKCTKLNGNCWLECKTNATLNSNNLETVFSEFNQLNLYVEKIQKNKNFYEIFCKDSQRNDIKIMSKKIVLACGTIATTKIVSEMLNYNKSIKIYHNPMLFGCFVAKQNVIDQTNHWLSQIASKLSINNVVSKTNFRISNNLIEKKISEDFGILFNNYFTKKIFNFLKKKLIFVNLYLDSSLSNLYFKKNEFNNLIFSDRNKTKEIKKILRFHFNFLYKVLLKNKLIYPVKFYQIPGMGHDNHFTGTLPINGPIKELSVNENCELFNFKDFYIVDGSVIPSNDAHFPTGIMIANALRIGKKFEHTKSQN